MLDRLQKIVKFFMNRPIKNYYNTNYTKRALLSYIVYPFRYRMKNTHTNHYEAITWGKILDELGYQVDITQYDDKSIDVSNYDVICGFGEVFFRCIYTADCRAKMIFYSTGRENCLQNYETLKRIKNVHEKKGVWLGESSRFVEKSYTSVSITSDAVISLGNDICADSYKKYNDNVFQLDAPIYKVLDYKYIIQNKKSDFQKHFLWFGSSGLVHKGLDLLLNYFSTRDDIFLHICGNIYYEKDFIKTYEQELFQKENINVYGFVDIKSEKFEEILKQCGFVIFPSCSEGGSPSVLTCVGNGGLIPIITKETTIDTGFDIWIENLDEEAIAKAVEKALLYSENNIKKISNQVGEYVLNKHSMENYYKNLKNIIENKIIKENMGDN